MYLFTTIYFYAIIISQKQMDVKRKGNICTRKSYPPVIRQILKGYEEGRVTREELEQAVRHLLIMIKRIRLAD